MNELLIGASVHFRSQSAEMGLDDLGLAIKVEVPHLLKEHRTRDYPAGISHQIFEQLILLGL